MTDVVSVLEEQTVVTETDDAVVIQTTSDDVIVVSADSGPQGVPGPTGPAGTPGSPGRDGTGDLTYEQDFAAATSVTVTHNLKKYPSVTVIDSAGDVCIGSVDHLSKNQLVISFSAAFSGSVICN